MEGQQCVAQVARVAGCLTPKFISFNYFLGIDGELSKFMSAIAIGYWTIDVNLFIAFFISMGSLFWNYGQTSNIYKKRQVWRRYKKIDYHSSSKSFVEPVGAIPPWLPRPVWGSHGGLPLRKLHNSSRLAIYGESDRLPKILLFGTIWICPKLLKFVLARIWF